MSKKPSPSPTKPGELIVLSAIIALFTALVTMMAIRDLVMSLIIFGVAFIATLMTIAMLALAAKPKDQLEGNVPLLDKHDKRPDHQVTPQPEPTESAPTGSAPAAPESTESDSAEPSSTEDEK